MDSKHYTTRHSRQVKGLVSGACLCLIFPLTLSAQYYPAASPVNPAMERRLAASLKQNKTKQEKAVLLLSLANINLYKPFRRSADLDRAARFANSASKLSFQVKDEAGFNNAGLLLADILTFQNDMHSAETIASSLNDTSKIKLWLNLSFKYLNRKGENKGEDWKKSMYYAGEAKAASDRLHLREYRLLAEKDIAMVHAARRIPAAEGELLTVLKKYREMRSAKLQYIYSGLSEYYYSSGNYSRAALYSTKAIDIIKATGDTIIAGDIYYQAALISFADNDFQKSFDFAGLAIDNLKRHAGKYSLNDHLIFRTAVLSLQKMGKLKEALRFALQTQKEYPAIEAADRVEDARVLGGLYRELKLFNQAQAAFLYALAAGKNRPDIDPLLYKDIGQLYVETKQYSRSKPYLNKLWSGKDRVTDSTLLSHIHYLLFRADSATGDYKSAVAHLSAFRGLEEVNLKNVKARELKRLESEYGTKEKENALKIKQHDITLLERKSRLQQIKLKQSKFQRDGTIAAIVLLLTISGLFFRLYVGKKRKHRLITKKSEVISRQNEEITQKNGVISQKSMQLELLLREKDWLLKEVHHRVKNNLHTVICLLESQAAFLKNDALKAIEKSQHRIYTMSLIHQKLYQSDDLETIDMAGYIPELIQYIKDSFETSGEIYFRYDLDKIKLDASLAIPVALIINEAFTNSIKYAFPESGNGQILITLRDLGDLVRLDLSDNGIGMKKNSPQKRSRFLGLELMRGLTREIHGNISFKNNNGVKITVIFKKEPLSPININEAGLLTPA